MTALKERVTDLMHQNLKIPQERITDEAVFGDLDLDSLALLEFAVLLEKEFDVEIEDEEITPDQTLLDMTRLLSDKGAG